MESIKTKEALLIAMENGATIITPNNRLSHQWIDEYFHTRKSPVCSKPRCLPYQAFLTSLYKKARHLYANKEHPLLLTAHQQDYLWRQLLKNSPHGSNAGLVHEVKEAYSRCEHWMLDTNHPSFSFTPQTRQFIQWLSEFKERLIDLHAITEEQLVPQLLTYPELFQSDHFIWVSFDDFMPQQTHLQEAMKKAGKLYQYEPPTRLTTSHQFVAKDQEEEYLCLFDWIKRKLVTQKERIAIVIPDLNTQSQTILRRLERQLSTDVFNISLGLPLIEYPVIAHAIGWLLLNQTDLSQDEARLLLHSPYLKGAKEEFIARSEFMQQSPWFKEPRIPMKALLHSLKENAPVLFNLLNTLPAYKEEAPAEEWVKQFKARLLHLEFPGDYPQSSLSYQCLQRLNALFDEFLQLAVISPIMKKSEALEAFQQLASTTIFQPQKPKTPIQILGLLEAAGGSYDSLWMCGLTDRSLPQPPHLSAFIPIALQREYQMPHASSERELQLATQLFYRLQQGSVDSVFSYPLLSGETPNLPSPLLVNLPLLDLKTLRSPVVQNALIIREEKYQIPLNATEIISGGTSLLSNQAKCPFKAFATHRLHAKQAPEISFGPEASERGQILHRILELFWHKIKNQEQLLALPSEALQTHIEQCIVSALKPLVNEERPSFSTIIKEVEVSRLNALMQAYIQWEKQRPPFEVLATEQAFTIRLAGIDFRLRIDRLDSIGLDKICVIDYKSRLPTIKPWHDERPEAPQLLLYSLVNESINTLIFVELRARHITLSGFSEEPLPLDGVKPIKKDEEWSDYQQQWRQQLTALAQEFGEGHCAPSPRRATTCQQCDFSSLCRIKQ